MTPDDPKPFLVDIVYDPDGKRRTGHDEASQFMNPDLYTDNERPTPEGMGQTTN